MREGSEHRRDALVREALARRSPQLLPLLRLLAVALHLLVLGLEQPLQARRARGGARSRARASCRGPASARRREAAAGLARRPVFCLGRRREERGGHAVNEKQGWGGR